MKGINSGSAFLWGLVVLSGVLVGCEVSVSEAAGVGETSVRSDGKDTKKVVKRETISQEEENKCTEVEVPDTGKFVRMRKVNQLSFTFFLRPEGDFQAVKFNLLIDNLWNAAGPYESYENIVFDRRDFDEVELERKNWIEFNVEYFKHEVNNGRDKLALRVTVGNTTREAISNRWWRTHAFVGSLVSVKGPATLLFDCPPQDPVSPIPARLLNTPALFGGILAAVFLLVTVPWACVLLRRRSSTSEEQPKIPPLPKSLLLQKDKVSKNPDHDNLYEEFDEDTLSRLRQKLNAQVLGGESDDPIACHHYEKLKPRPELRQEKMEKQQSSPENYYENAPVMSLREEKEKAKKIQRQRSLSESHYVEMHGILNRKSFDLSK